MVPCGVLCAVPCFVPCGVPCAVPCVVPFARPCAVLCAVPHTMLCVVLDAVLSTVPLAEKSTVLHCLSAPATARSETGCGNRAVPYDRADHGTAQGRLRRCRYESAYPELLCGPLSDRPLSLPSMR